jgi:hypothetical protein
MVTELYGSPAWIAPTERLVMLMKHTHLMEGDSLALGHYLFIRPGRCFRNFRIFYGFRDDSRPIVGFENKKITEALAGHAVIFS